MKIRQVFFSALLALLPGSVLAQNYSFNCITNNNAADCATGHDQLSLTVAASGGGVDFLFANAGPNKSSITDIYFDWGTGAALTGGTITNSAGVSFSWEAAPPDLPGGNVISFSADLGADSNSPTQPNGVNPGESLTIHFANASASVIDALNANGLRVGTHVQGFPNGGSESFVVTPVPEPETYAMLLAGLGLMGFVVRRRRASA